MSKSYKQLRARIERVERLLAQGGARAGHVGAGEPHQETENSHETPVSPLRRPPPAEPLSAPERPELLDNRWLRQAFMHDTEFGADRQLGHAEAERLYALSLEARLRDAERRAAVEVENRERSEGVWAAEVEARLAAERERDRLRDERDAEIRNAEWSKCERDRLASQLAEAHRQIAVAEQEREKAIREGPHRYCPAALDAVWNALGSPPCDGRSIGQHVADQLAALRAESAARVPRDVATRAMVRYARSWEAWCHPGDPLLSTDLSPDVSRYLDSELAAARASQEKETRDV